MKIRHDDRLSNLSPTDRAKLDGWLRTHTYRDIVRLAAAPLPHGLDLNTNIRALSIYYNKYLAPSPLDRIVKIAETNPTAAQSAAMALLHAQALTAASSPDLDLRTLNTLVRFHGNHVRDEQHKRSASLRELELALSSARQSAQPPNEKP